MSRLLSNRELARIKSNAQKHDYLYSDAPDDVRSLLDHIQALTLHADELSLSLSNHLNSPGRHIRVDSGDVFQKDVNIGIHARCHEVLNAYDLEKRKAFLE